jgi:hypothetical protein
MPLTSIITGNPCPPALKTGCVNLPFLHGLISGIELAPHPLKDEQVLTYLCAYGYAIHADGSLQFARLLTEDDTIDSPNALWFEFLPRSPRHNEGETNLDLAIGHLRCREGTRSGIEFDPAVEGKTWVGFVEVKLRSDLATHVKYDPFRNQLLRVVENAVTLRHADAMPRRVHVILVSPSVFKHHVGSRFYGYKFDEYDNHREKILKDLGLLQLHPAHNIDLAPRVSPDVLSFHWITLETIIRAMPESDFKAALIDLVGRPGGLLNLEQ